MGIGVSLFLFAVLILFSAFFVATEFAIIKIRSSRVDQLVVENRKNALALQKVVNNLDGYLSACQLGITITALGLGWLGEPTVVKLLEPLFQQLNINGDFSHILYFYYFIRHCNLPARGDRRTGSQNIGDPQSGSCQFVNLSSHRVV